MIMASVLSPNMEDKHCSGISNKKDKQICKTLAFVEISTKRWTNNKKFSMSIFSTSSVSVEYQMKVVIRHYSKGKMVANLKLKSRISINFYSQLALIVGNILPVCGLFNIKWKSFKVNFCLRLKLWMLFWAVQNFFKRGENN